MAKPPFYLKASIKGKTKLIGNTSKPTTISTIKNTKNTIIAAIKRLKNAKGHKKIIFFIIEVTFPSTSLKTISYPLNVQQA